MKKIHIQGVISPPEYSNEFDDVQIYGLSDLLADLGDAQEATVYIDSPGGMVEEGMKMFDVLAARNITTVALNASSIASVLFLAGKERLIKPGAKMVIHNAWLKGQEIDSEMIINANSLDQLKEEFEKVDKMLINIYKKATALNETKLLALMAEDTDVAENAIMFGFATGQYQGEQESKELKSCIMFNAMYKNIILNQKVEFMASEQTNDKLNAIEKALSKLSNLLFGKVKSMSVELEDGTNIYVYSEDGEFAGKRAVLTDDEGMPTEDNAPEGMHKLQDGREVVIGEGGIISEVKEAADAEALAAELEAMEDEKKKMQEENEELKAKVAAMETETADKEQAYKEQFENLQNEIKALKDDVIGKVEDPKPVKALDAEELAKLSPSERFRLKMVAKAQNRI